MRDLNSIRQRDIDGGHFDLYVDDINFSEYQMETLMKNDICRLTEITRDDIHDESIFEKLAEVKDFLKGVLDKISNGQASVRYPGVKSYSEKILEVVENDIAGILKLDDKTFCHEDLLENILMRFLSIKFNEFEGLNETQMTEELSEKFDKYVNLYNGIMEKIERYRNIV